jgi:hypothetical protein
LKNNAQISLVNKLGEEVFYSIASNNILIETSKFEHGIYIITITQNKQTNHQKIVIY